MVLVPGIPSRAGDIGGRAPRRGRNPPTPSGVDHINLLAEGSLSRFPYGRWVLRVSDLLQLVGFATWAEGFRFRLWGAGSHFKVQLR